MQQYNTPPSPNPNSSTQLVFFLPQSAIAHTLSCSHQPASTHLAAVTQPLPSSSPHEQHSSTHTTSDPASSSPLTYLLCYRLHTSSHLGSNHPHASVPASAPVQPLLPAPHSRAWVNHFCRTPRAPTACARTSGHARTSAAAPHVRTAARSDLHCLLVPPRRLASARRVLRPSPPARAEARRRLHAPAGSRTSTITRSRSRIATTDASGGKPSPGSRYHVELDEEISGIGVRSLLSPSLYLFCSFTI
jgi:hypothetical protein